MSNLLNKMKQCDHIAIASFAASESDPEDSFWRDFNFDFSFLTSDDHKSGLVDDIDSNSVPKELAVVEEKEACLRKERTFSPLITKMSALRIKECDTEVDSPCWKGASSRNSAVASGTKSLNLKRSRDDLNLLYGLNPMAPQFIPSNAKKNGKEYEENGSSSLKRSLSSTFPPSSGDLSVAAPSEPGILIHDADQSLGLVGQDNVFKTIGILGISNQFQMPKKLDPLAPVFVPAYAVIHEKSGVADHMIANDRNAHSTYASSEVCHIGSNPYSNNVHESGKTYSSNPRLGSQVKKTEDSSSNKTHGSRKTLNPLAQQFSVADTKPKVYDLPSNVNSSVLLSPVGYRNHKELHAGFTQHSVHMGCHRPNILHGNSSPQMDVKKLLTTIHGLSELLTHVHGSEGSPNVQDFDLINCTVQNLNSYINNGVHEHTGEYCLTSLSDMCKQSPSEHQIPKATNMSANIDLKRKEKYSMVSGETGAEAPFEYGVVTKENGFGQVVRNHQAEEQINPQVLFYKSLWLNARANRSLMEYETFLSN